MVRNFIILTLIIFFSSAHAAENDNNMYKDWNDVVSLLRSKGIIASKINWTEIEASCSIVKNTENETAYNKCRFNKAADQNQYENDVNYCNAESQQKYFDFIKPSVTNVIINNSKGEAIPASEARKVVLSEEQKNDYKNSAYISCMRGVGWNNPSSWVNGRRDAGHK